MAALKSSKTLLLLLALFLIGAAGSAFADSAVPGTGVPGMERTYCAAEPGEIPLTSKIGEQEPLLPPAAGGSAAPQWSWRRAVTAEYAATALAIGGTLYVEKDNASGVRAKWTARNDLDEGVRDLLRLKGKSARQVASTASDALMWLMIAAPVADTTATLGLRDRRWDALWQTSVINLESFTFTSLASSLMQNLIARERPFVRNCVNGVCEAHQPNRSMPSGHVAFAFTGAGLICTHHKYQSLYGDPAADDAACATGLGLASVTGVLRLMSDRHYFTDVAAGTVIGLFSGFVLPRLLHYSWPVESRRGEKGEEPSLVQQVTLSPLLFDGGAGINCELTF